MADLDFDFNFSAANPGARKATDVMRILVLANLAGHHERSTGDWFGAPARAIDVDNFDAVFEKIAPCLKLRLADGEHPLPVRFKELDDFHPDALFAQVEVFQAEVDAQRARSIVIA